MFIIHFLVVGTLQGDLFLHMFLFVILVGIRGWMLAYGKRDVEMIWTITNYVIARREIKHNCLLNIINIMNLSN